MRKESANTLTLAAQLDELIAATVSSSLRSLFVCLGYEFLTYCTFTYKSISVRIIYRPLYQGIIIIDAIFPFEV